jgi:hypothetical protein
LLKNSVEIPFHTSLTYNKLRDENEKEAKWKMCKIRIYTKKNVLLSNIHTY